MTGGGHFRKSMERPRPTNSRIFRSQAGDEIRIVSPGGGGYGPPETREPSEVLDDLREGLVSLEEAQEVYAVALVQDDGDWHIDEGYDRGTSP